MALTNCPRCGKLFNKFAISICSDCLAEEERRLRKTQEYLRKNPNATIVQLTKDMDEQFDIQLDRPTLEKWANDGRISIVFEQDVENTYHCSLCGRETKAGETICKTCKFTKLSRAKEEESIFAKPKLEGSSSKMRQGMHYKRWDGN